MAAELTHHNNFGFLRLLFATLVIVSHSAEIIDGNRSRELLTNIGGVLTFAELAVDGFFIISGYLVLKSFETSATVAYLLKRVRRIYPGFLAAYVICVFAIGPFVGVDFRSLSLKSLLRLAMDALTLNGPSLSGFTGLPIPALNGSMWTIIYEFKCYLYIIGIAAIGIYKKPFLFAAVTAALLISNEIHWPTYIGPVAKFVGSPTLFIRLEGLFCVGSCFYIFRSRIPYMPSLLAGAGVTLVLCLYFSILAEAAFAIFGGYLMFWVALHFKSEILQRINGRNDISYGVYLYAWPVQSCLVYFFHIRTPWILTALTIPIVYAAGLVSWKLVEQRFLSTKNEHAREESAAVRS